MSNFPIIFAEIWYGGETSIKHFVQNFDILHILVGHRFVACKELVLVDESDGKSETLTPTPKMLRIPFLVIIVIRRRFCVVGFQLCVWTRSIAGSQHSFPHHFGWYRF